MHVTVDTDGHLVVIDKDGAKVEHAIVHSVDFPVGSVDSASGRVYHIKGEGIAKISVNEAESIVPLRGTGRGTVLRVQFDEPRSAD